MTDEFRGSMPNVPLLSKTMDHIEAHPEEWDQSMWATRKNPQCGTIACFAGTSVLLADPDAKMLFIADGGYLDLEDGESIYVAPSSAALCVDGTGRTRRIDNYAKQLLGLNSTQAANLFRGTNTMNHLRRYVAELTSE